MTWAEIFLKHYEPIMLYLLLINLLWVRKHAEFYHSQLCLGINFPPASLESLPHISIGFQEARNIWRAYPALLWVSHFQHFSVQFFIGLPLVLTRIATSGWHSNNFPLLFHTQSANFRRQSYGILSHFLPQPPNGIIPLWHQSWWFPCPTPSW